MESHVAEQPNTQLLVLVDDEPQLLRSASVVLRTAGIESVITLEDGRELQATLEQNKVDAVLLDLNMPHISGVDLLSEVCERHPDIPVIMMTAANELEIAVDCMRRGAVDYLVKPVDKARLITSVNRALELRSLREEVENLRATLLDNTIKNPAAFAPIVTEDDDMLSLFRYMEAVARTPQPVLVTGETGTGKELFARALHDASGRSGNFVAVSVSGLDDIAFSDTLFGHKRGAFTGAESKRDGLIKTAQNGTIFLDEIGDLSESSQVKLLRLLQEKEFYPLGEDHPVNTNARVVCATNVDLLSAIKDGKFRLDLYYRLRSHHIQIPSLRQRIGDLPALIEHLVAKAAKDFERTPPSVPVELYTLLKQYAFPGNIRELEGMIFDAVARQQGTALSLASFHTAIGNNSAEQLILAPAEMASGAGWGDDQPLPTLKEAEDQLIQAALTRAEGNQGIAATLLGITRQALNKRLVRAREKN